MSKKSLSIFGILSAILIVSLSASIISAYPGTVREKTFITIYGEPIGDKGVDTYNVYEYSGIHWPAGKEKIAYFVNLKGAPSGSLNEIKTAFETWDAEVKADLFDDQVATTTKLMGSKYDGKNVISWGRLGRGIIAQTTVWYYPDSGEIVEFGMVFSTSYRWGIDADGEGSANTLTNAFDVQNIATHEAGHTLMLEDLYMDEASALTMYGYGDFGETYAISLGAGDISGVKDLYP